MTSEENLLLKDVLKRSFTVLLCIFAFYGFCVAISERIAFSRMSVDEIFSPEN